MHVVFAALFFLFIGLSETLRHGIFGLSPSETTGIMNGALVLSALIILRGDVVYILRQPRHPLYGSGQVNWSWPRSFLGLFLGPVLWLLPIVYGLSLIQINFNPLDGDVVLRLVLVQVLLVALAENLFFREAAVKAFCADTASLYAASGLALFVFYLPHGIPAALIAAGAGVYFLTLRLIGTNLLIVAALHGATTVFATEIISLGLTSAEMWSYSIYFFAAAAALSMLVFHLFARNRKDLIYA